MKNYNFDYKNFDLLHHGRSGCYVLISMPESIRLKNLRCKVEGELKGFNDNETIEAYLMQKVKEDSYLQTDSKVIFKVNELKYESWSLVNNGS